MLKYSIQSIKPIFLFPSNSFIPTISSQRTKVNWTSFPCVWNTPFKSNRIVSETKKIIRFQEWVAKLLISQINRNDWNVRKEGKFLILIKQNLTASPCLILYVSAKNERTNVYTLEVISGSVSLVKMQLVPLSIELWCFHFDLYTFLMRGILMNPVRFFTSLYCNAVSLVISRVVALITSGIDARDALNDTETWVSSWVQPTLWVELNV